MASTEIATRTTSRGTGRLGPPRSPLHGTWEVERFERRGVLAPACGDDSERWTRVLIEGESFAVFSAGPKPRAYELELDSARGVLKLKGAKTQVKRTLRFTLEGPKLLLEGSDDALHIELRHKTSYPLLRDRFDWVHGPAPGSR